jgi:hypothetical protein
MDDADETKSQTTQADVSIDSQNKVHWAGSDGNISVHSVDITNDARPPHSRLPSYIFLACTSSASAGLSGEDQQCGRQKGRSGLVVQVR